MIKAIYRNPEHKFDGSRRSAKYVSDWPMVIASIDGLIVDPDDYLEFVDGDYAVSADGNQIRGDVRIHSFQPQLCTPCIQKMRQFEWDKRAVYFNGMSRQPSILTNEQLDGLRKIRVAFQFNLDQ